MQTIQVKTPTSHYPIFLGEDILNDMGKLIKNLGFSGPCALVTNPTVGQHHAEPALQSLSNYGFKPTLCQIPDGEQYKTLETVASLYDQFLTVALERKSPIIALGGGVLGDITGFAAATYLRGVPFIQIPTTLLAMVDASVGGKTGVDLPQGKNLVGAFKQPELVLVDSAVLSTLPAPEFRAGLAEVIKHGIIDNPELFAKLHTGDFDLLWMLTEAIKVKVQVVQEDPFEQGRRATLNLGHTFGHAFEQISNFQLRHGEGVAMGLVCAARLAVELGHCQAETLTQIINLIEHVGLPTQSPAYDADTVWQVMHTDKKKQAGRLRFILPRKIGVVDIFNDVPESAVKAIL